MSRLLIANVHKLGCSVRNILSYSKFIAYLATLCASTSALAQLEEVLVTAQKRPESMLEAPLSLVVISEQELQQSHCSQESGL